MAVGDQVLGIEDLKEKIIRVRKGRKLSYVTDTVFSESVVEKVKELAMGSDILFCESTFLEEDAHLAEKYHHLTARQAASLAEISSSKKLVLFHISSRYSPFLFKAVEEARTVFADTEIASRIRKTRNRINGNHSR